MGEVFLQLIMRVLSNYLFFRSGISLHLNARYKKIGNL